MKDTSISEWRCDRVAKHHTICRIGAASEGQLSPPFSKCLQKPQCKHLYIVQEEPRGSKEMEPEMLKVLGVRLGGAGGVASRRRKHGMTVGG